MSSQRARHKNERDRPEFEFYGTKRAVFKPLKSKSMADRAPLASNNVILDVGTRMKGSVPIERM